MGAAAFGASTYGNEASKEPSLLGMGGPDRDREEAGMVATVGGMGIAGIGLVVAILGIVLLVWGLSRARRELIEAARRTA